MNTLFIWWVKCKLNGWIKAWKYVRGRHLQQKRHYWTFSEERPSIDHLILSSLSIQFGTYQFKRSLYFRCKVFCICSKYLNKLLEKCPNFSARISTVTKKNLEVEGRQAKFPDLIFASLWRNGGLQSTTTGLGNLQRSFANNRN